MKQLTVASNQPPGAAPARASWEGTLLDGRSFRGPRGVIAVALSPETLAELRRHASPTHWLIPVENPALVRAAASLPGEVLWLCRRHPAALLGELHDALRGAWLEPQALVVNLDGQPQRQPLNGLARGAEALTSLARAVVEAWTAEPSARPFLSPLVVPVSLSSFLAAA